MRLYEVPIEICKQLNVDESEIEKPEYFLARATIDLDSIDFVYEQIAKDRCRLLFRSREDLIVLFPYAKMVQIWKCEMFCLPVPGQTIGDITENKPINTELKRRSEEINKWDVKDEIDDMLGNHV
jgi:hypothetical protein